MDDCYSCRHNAQLDPPPRESVVRTEHWRVVHSFNSALPGWLVLLPAFHVRAFDELEPGALNELGPLIGRLSGALRQVVGCGALEVRRLVGG